jgi:hypothetical protein
MITTPAPMPLIIEDILSTSTENKISFRVGIIVSSPRLFINHHGCNDLTAGERLRQPNIHVYRGCRKTKQVTRHEKFLAWEESNRVRASSLQALSVKGAFDIQAADEKAEY